MSTRSPSPAERPRFTSASGRRAGRRGRRGHHQPPQLRRLGQLPALRGRQAGLLRHRSGHPEPWIPRRSRPRSGRRRPGSCRSTSSATRPTCRRSRELASEQDLGMLEDACQALGAHRQHGPQDRHRRAISPLRLLRQQADDDGGGRHPRHARQGGRGARQAASATRAGHRTWTRSSTIASGSTTGSPTYTRRSGSRSSSGSTRCSTRATTSRPSTASGSPSSAPRPPASTRNHDIVLPCENRGDERRSWFVFVRPAAGGKPTATRVIASLERAAASPPRPTCPASTCCRPIASASASGAASSRSRNGSLSARSRCPSSPR